MTRAGYERECSAQDPQPFLHADQSQTGRAFCGIESYARILNDQLHRSVILNQLNGYLFRSPVFHRVVQRFLCNPE